jgi:hypothetical protein
MVANDQGRQCEGRLGQATGRPPSPAVHDRPDRRAQINLIANLIGLGHPAAGHRRFPCLIWTKVSNSNYPFVALPK